MAEVEFKFPDEEGSETQVNIEAEKPEVEVKSEKPDVDPSDDELSEYGQRVQRRMKKFSEGYHEEKRARETAEQERLAAEEFAKAVYQENQNLKSQLKNGSEAYIQTSKHAAEVELEAAKKKLKEAFEAGDADKLVSAQEEISKATLKIDRASTMRPVEIQDNFQVPQRQQPAQEQITPRTKTWVSDNSDWFGKDDEMTMLAMGLDKKLQREYGANYIGTEEYFRTIDNAMRKRFPEYFDTQSDDDDRTSQTRSTPAVEESPRRARSASPVAPASRSTPPSRVRLKPSQVALARKLGITPEAYAQQVAILSRGE
jgi:hypothetical protein